MSNPTIFEFRNGRLASFLLQVACLAAGSVPVSAASGESSGAGAAEGPIGPEESVPAVEVRMRFMEVPNSSDVFDWLLRAGDDIAITDAETELTPHSGRLPEGTSNAFVRQLTGIVASDDIKGDLDHLFHQAPAGSDFVTQRATTVSSGREAAIMYTQTDPEGIEIGVVTDVTPIYDADREIVRLTLTATVTGSTDVAPGADPEYHVRQVKLDDYEVPAGQTVVMGGFVDRDVSRGVKGLFVFVTPELVEPPPDEADSDL